MKLNENEITQNKEEMLNMTFSINNLRTESEFAKKVFKPENLAQINKNRE
jgi:hypothetical protein